LSLLLVLALLRGFFSGFSGVPPSKKPNTSKFQFDLETVNEEPLRGKMSLQIPICLSIFEKHKNILSNLPARVLFPTYFSSSYSDCKNFTGYTVCDIRNDQG